MNFGDFWNTLNSAMGVQNQQPTAAQGGGPPIPSGALAKLRSQDFFKNLMAGQNPTAGQSSPTGSWLSSLANVGSSVASPPPGSPGASQGNDIGRGMMQATRSIPAIAQGASTIASLLAML